ncbi:MAG: DUF3299 domain-containing protein [Mariniblastus sp.]
MNATTFTENKPVTQALSGGDNNEFEYRSVSKSAIACIVFAVLGLMTAFLAPHFIVIPALSVVFGIVSLLNFRWFPSELIGKPVAIIGLIASSLCFAGSTSYHSYVYATEVPDGHIRVSFGELRPNSRSKIPFAERATELDGQKVFIKGYVRPSTKRRKLKEFILVGDFGSCCFGGNPKITDVIAVNIIGDQTVDYGYSLRKITGTFRLNTQTKQTEEADIPQIFYEIEADLVK